MTIHIAYDEQPPSASGIVHVLCGQFETRWVDIGNAISATCTHCRVSLDFLR